MKDVKESCTVKASKDMESLVKFFHLKKVTETPQKYSNICSNKNFPTKQSITTTMEIDSPNHWRDKIAMSLSIYEKSSQTLGKKLISWYETGKSMKHCKLLNQLSIHSSTPPSQANVNQRR